MNNRALPSLNGWRAVSILLVLGCHSTMVAGFSKDYARLGLAIFDGNLGVRFFFIISGFLITWLLLMEEMEFKSISLKNFYIRRTLRIWPVYFCYVLLLGLFQIFGIAAQHESAWRGLLTFTRNFYDAKVGLPGDIYSAHCWSLSIEEQFYLVWPLAFCFFKTRWRVGFLILIIFLSWAFKIIYATGFYSRYAVLFFQNYSTFLYTDCLAWGCLAAMLYFAQRQKLERLFQEKGAVIFPIAISAVLAPAIIDFGKGIQAAGFVVLLLHSICESGAKFYRVLNFKWISYVGVLSYSIYIWQEMVQVLWPKSLGAVWFMWIPVTFAIAWASYKFLEKPFYALRAKFREPRAKISAPVAGVFKKV